MAGRFDTLLISGEPEYLHLWNYAGKNTNRIARCSQKPPIEIQ
jgi:hypothetical protein